MWVVVDRGEGGWKVLVGDDGNQLESVDDVIWNYTAVEHSRAGIEGYVPKHGEGLKVYFELRCGRELWECDVWLKSVLTIVGRVGYECLS